MVKRQSSKRLLSGGAFIAFISKKGAVGWGGFQRRGLPAYPSATILFFL